MLAGRDDLLFKFWHAWLGSELVVISQDGRKKPSRIREESSDTSSAHHKREDVGDQGHKDDMQSMESHKEGLGTNSLSRASSNKESEVKIKPRSLGGHRRLKYGQVCMDRWQGRGQSLSFELLGLWEIFPCSQAPSGSWKCHQEMDIPSCAALPPGESDPPCGAAGKSTREVWEPEGQNWMG